MADKGNTNPSSLLESANIPGPTWTQRVVRWLFRQRPLAEKAEVSIQMESDPRLFQPTEEGSGNFGRWILDSVGLPAYQYEMDQFKDPRAIYPNTEGLERCDHWHQVGNHRITALAANDGTVQVYSCDRGGVFLNRFEAWDYDRPGPSLLLLVFRLLRFLSQLLSQRARRRSPGLSPFEVNAYAAAQSKSSLPRGVVPPEVVTQSAQTQSEGVGATSGNRLLPRSRKNYRDPVATRYAYAGGFAYINDGAETWATAYRYRPHLAQTRRVFGIGYFETEMSYRNISVQRKLYAPFLKEEQEDKQFCLGDDPLLLVDVSIQNTGANPVSLRYYEYWDINIQQLQIEWLRSGLFGPVSDEARRMLNRNFIPRIEWCEAFNGLHFTQRLVQPPPVQALPADKSCDIDWEPAGVLLASLEGKPDAWYVNKAEFFGSGGARQPDAIHQDRHGNTISGAQPGVVIPYCLVLRHDITLQPGETRTLRFAYGTVKPDAKFDFLTKFQQPRDFWTETVNCWKDNLAYFSTGKDPVLQREMAWHAYNLASATVFSAFHCVHLVPQGSAYLYLHGADGAPRDQALFVLPMTYLNPRLARDMLRLIMRLTDGKTGQITYAFCGHGFLSNGLNVHTKPSDLDLFFLLAMNEYLSATGDLAFLDEEVPFYPPDMKPSLAEGITVLDHIRVAINHIFAGVGIGEHGLIKVGSGDWSDSIVLETALRDGPGPFGVTYQNSKENGESVPNTQLALYVLPLLVAILKQQVSDLITEERLESLHGAVRRQWNENGWYNRAVLRGFTNNPLVIDRFDLEAQPWALIGDLGDDKEAVLIERIDQLLDRPSPIGAALVEGGMVWPAVSQLLTWAYAHCERPNLAWRSLNRHTFAVHAHVYPNIWFNIWSGPDGINGLKSDWPGGTWASPITPMMDFPVMNANQDAMALLGLLRVGGIEPSPAGDGLRIFPHVPRERFVLDMPLLRLECAPRSITGKYHAFANGSRKFYIHVPQDVSKLVVSVNGKILPDVQPVNAEVAVPLVFEAGQEVEFQVRWAEQH